MAFTGPLQLTYLEVYWEMTKVLKEAVSIPVQASVAKSKGIDIFKKYDALQNKIFFSSVNTEVLMMQCRTTIQ